MEIIEKKLKEHVCILMMKDEITTDDGFFLLRMLERAEMKEKARIQEAEHAKMVEQWRQSLLNLSKGFE